MSNRYAPSGSDDLADYDVISGAVRPLSMNVLAPLASGMRSHRFSPGERYQSHVSVYI